MVDVRYEPPAERKLTITLTETEAQQYANWGYAEIPINRESTAKDIYEGLKALGIQPFD